MIIVNTQTDKIQVVLSGAPATIQPAAFSSWRDLNDVAGTFTPGRNPSLLNGVTDVDLIPSPGVNVARVVDFISVYNQDTGNVTVTVKFNANGTIIPLFKATLAVGETLEYTNEYGWRVITNGGGIKMDSGNAPTSNVINTIILGNDVPITDGVSANILKDVTGFGFNGSANKTYWFRIIGSFDSNATTNGLRMCLNGPALTRLAMESRYSLTLTTQTLNEAVSAYDSPAGASATCAAVNGNNFEMEGFITISANGFIQIRCASETAAGTITIKAGSMIQWQEIL